MLISTVLKTKNKSVTAMNRIVLSVCVGLFNFFRVVELVATKQERERERLACLLKFLRASKYIRKIEGDTQPQR